MSRLAEIRAARGLTQQALAVRVGASIRAVAAWEGDGVTPLPIFQEKLARILRVSVDELGFAKDGKA